MITQKRVDEVRKLVDDLTFGLVVTIVGMGGTLCVLAILSLLVSLLKRLTPPGKDS